MLEPLIDRLTRASLRFKWVTIALAIVALVAGVIALVQLNQELIPNIEFPTTIVLAFNSGMEPEEMRDEVTIPIEDAVKDIEGVVNIESTTASGRTEPVVISRGKWSKDSSCPVFTLPARSDTCPATKLTVIVPKGKPVVL